MDHLPIFLDVRDRPVIVVGGGTVAARKAEMVLRAGARVTVYADELSEDFRGIADHERLRHSREQLTAEAFVGAALAYTANEDPVADQAVVEIARAAGVLVNVADTPQQCDFIMPAILDRDPLVVAISSSGASPILARMIKARLEATIPAAYGRLAAFVGRFRDKVSAKLSPGSPRRRFWERVLEGPIADLVLSGAEDQAAAELDAALAAISDDSEATAKGEVYLVGA
ncbi:MAG: bifunctional precorrin-2 dehydrogenase/sirohydrochlorin ferrochelatase, partial [Hyphomicrobiales bacterium]|nr:bifunctional precorrin-2 dehydrogenase/sirohydrochlorin ferrochelatase [Hyphomicrobiales bacterium]